LSLIGYNSNTYISIRGVVTIKGAKVVVKCNEKLYLHYFEKPPLIIFNEFFVNVLELCLFIHEVGIP
jgi:hypothetical protein